MFTTLSRGATALALLASLTLTACDSGEPDGPPNEEELITQVAITLTNDDDAGDSVTITGTASDGEVIDTFTPSRITLRPGATYSGTIALDDTINNVDITDEVRDEADEHLFRYSFQPASGGTVTLTDSESDYQSGGRDIAVGLTFQATVASGASGTGTLSAVLYHFDDAPKTSSTATSDEIDVDIAFPIQFAAPVTAR